MHPTDRSHSRWKQRVLTVGLAVLLVGSVFVSVAAADAGIAVRDAEVSATTVTVGETVTVTADAVNVGDSGGGYTLDFERNGTEYGTRWTSFDTKRVSLAPDEYRTVNATLQFDRPGTYKIRVDNTRAGIVTVQPARARVAAENDTRRRIDIRADGVSSSEPTDFDVPTSDQSVALQQWSTRTGQSAFQQYLTEYTDRSAMPGSVPADATLLAVVDFDSDDSFEAATMRIAVAEGAISNSTLERDEVTVYQRNGTVWEPLGTTVAAGSTDSPIYEATVTRGTTYAVGRIDPNITVTNTSYGTTAGASGPRLSLEAQVRNTAPVAGTYTGAMRVNGETVNRTTVTVPASGLADISLSEGVTEPGSYSLELNGTAVGSVFIAESQVGTPRSADATPGAVTATSTPTGASGDGDDGPADALPPTILGIDTLYVLGGLAIALVAFVLLLLLIRRGGDGGGDGLQDTFDPF